MSMRDDKALVVLVRLVYEFKCFFSLNLFVADVISTGLLKWSVGILSGSEFNLVEDELGDCVGESGGNWEGIGFWLVSTLGVGDKLQLEWGAIGMSEAHGSLEETKHHSLGANNISK